MRVLSSILLSVLLTTSVNAGPYETIMKAGIRLGISKAVIQKVVSKESRFNCSPHNRRYHGPLQVSTATARRFGYRGGPLNNCGAGLKYGMMHVAMCVHRYGNSPGAVAACHARGG